MAIIYLYLRPGDIETERGVWQRGKHAEALKKSAIISCPYCGQWVSLSHHTIAKNGDVSPSLVCPHDGCDFHEYIHLQDWRVG